MSEFDLLIKKWLDSYNCLIFLLILFNWLFLFAPLKYLIRKETNVTLSLNTNELVQIGLLIIAIAGIISPVIVSVVNNIYNYRIQKLESISKVKQNILEKFSYYINQRYGCSTYDKDELFRYVNLLYIYFDVDDNLLFKILFSEYDKEELFQEDVRKFFKKLSKQVKYK